MIPQNKHRPRVLIVDDDDVIAMLAAADLSRFNVEVQRVNNGLDAVCAAKSSFFDLILMEVQMPVLNGILATVQIRNNEYISGSLHAIIVGVTSGSNRMDCLSSGMDDFERKPANYDGILRRHVPASCFSVGERPA